MADIIRRANPEDAAFLSELALRSKAYWGYSQDFLESCRSELSIDPERMCSDNYLCFVAIHKDMAIGFYAVEKVSGTTYELEALFVEPEHIGAGVGRSLVQHAIGLLSDLGAERLVIQGDPNAAAFYLAAGARQTGTRESGSIPGRHLPLFEIDIANR
jgi:GNAT superfamily N-acetyltransferase